MRTKLLTILLGLLGLFVAITLVRVDQLLFGEKLNWSEAQARAQAGALSEAISSEIKNVSQILQISWPQLAEAKKDYPKGRAYSRFTMMASFSRTAGGDWNIDQRYFLEGTPVKTWAPNYSVLALKSVKANEVPVGGTLLVALLDPSGAQVHLLFLTRTPTQWLAALLGTELFQSVMDRQKGQVAKVFAVNPLGQTLAHTEPSYVGKALGDDPIVVDLVKSEGGSGSGLFETGTGLVQGLYEQVPRTNVFVVVATPLSEVLANRSQVRWQILLMGLGFALVGAALVMGLIREGKGPAPSEASLAPAAAAPAPVATSGPDLTHVRHDAFVKASSSLAHELKGPLLSLLGRARLLRENSEDEQMRKELLKLEEGAREAHGTLHKLLTFAGEKEEEMVPVALGEVLQRTLKLMEPRLKSEGVEVETRIEPVSLIHGQPNLLLKAFEQLIENSIEAMDRSLNKKLIVELNDSDTGPKIRIVDTGEGIQPENLSQVFDPFFTTRSSRDHSGLGLSLALGIIKGGGGKMGIESKPGQGTQVQVFFPYQRVAQVREETAAAEPPRLGPDGVLRAPEEGAEPPPAARKAADLQDLPDVLNDSLMQRALDMIDRLDDLPDPFVPEGLAVPTPPSGTVPSAGEGDEPFAGDAPPGAPTSYPGFSSKLDKPKSAPRRKDQAFQGTKTGIRRPGERS